MSQAATAATAATQSKEAESKAHSAFTSNMSQAATAAAADTPSKEESKVQSASTSSSAAATDAQLDETAEKLAGLSVADSSSSGSKNVTAAAPAAVVVHPERPLGPAAAPPRVTLSSLAARIASGELKRIVVLTGAGISVSAGIPDFRSPNTGLYANLQKYNLPHPTAVFELDYFRRHPAPFFMLAKELYPGVYRPTPTHMFIRALDEHGWLLRAISQNIDGLELVAGLRQDRLVQAHGGFSRAACIDCHQPHPESFVKEAVFADRIPRCTAQSCGGLVKPAITFFGESLPPEFGRAVQRDLPAADLLIVAGTSLQVQPFASLVGRVGKHVPRILINRECVGAAPGGGVDGGADDDEDEAEAMLRQHPQYSALADQLALTRNEKMRVALQDMLQQIKRRLFGEDSSLFNFRSGQRDVFVKDDCDSGVRRLAKLIGEKFAKRVEQLVEEDRAKHPRAAAKDGEEEAGKGADKVAQAIAASAHSAAHAKDAMPNTASITAAPAQSATSESASAPAAVAGAAAAATKPSGPEPSAAPASSASSSASSADSSPLAIGFDFDHTLGVDHGLELNALRLLSGDLGKASCCDDEGFRVRMERALKSFRDGLSDQKQLMQELMDQLGLPADKDVLGSLSAKWQSHCLQLATKTEALPGALDLLRWLRSACIPYAIYTNGWSPLQAHKVAAALGDLAPPAESMLVSDVVGPIKPARAAFDALRQCSGFAGLPPKSVWYVGDNAAGDVGGAMKAGLTAVWLDAEGQTYPSGQPPPDHSVASLKELRPIIEAELNKLRAERKKSASGGAPSAAAAASTEAGGSPAKL